MSRDEARSLLSRMGEVLHLSIPAAASMLSYTLVGVVDTIMVGHLGANSLAAVGIANTVLFTIGAFVMGLLHAVSPLVAQNVGAGQHAEVGRVLHQGTWLSLVLGSIAGWALFMGSDLLLGVLGQSPDVITQGADYLGVRALGLPLFYMAVTRDNFFEGLGDTRTPMVLNIVVNVVHLLLGLWFIPGGMGLAPMGVMGAAVATVLSHALGLVLAQLVLSSRHRREPRWEILPTGGVSRIHLGRLLKVGWPMGVQFAMDIGSWAMMTLIMGSFGATALAASQVAMRLINVTSMTGHGVGIATTALVGRELGAGRKESARGYSIAGAMLAVAWAVMLSLVYLMAPVFWVELFTREPAVVDLAVALLLIGLLIQATDVLQMVLYGALRGAGDTRWPMYTSWVCCWLMGLPLAWFLAVYLNLGPRGIYAALAVEFLVMGVTFLHRVLGDRWLEQNLVETSTLNPDVPDGESVPARLDTSPTPA